MWNVPSLVKNKLFLSQNETQSKRKRPKFLIALAYFLYKVWIVQYGFLGTIFSVSWNFYIYNEKLLFYLEKTSFS